MSKSSLPDGTLEQRQSLSLESKVALANRRIRQWHGYWNGETYVAFSGGKDSTVLLHLVRNLYPDVPAVFCDTGLEFPEIREFVRGMDQVTWLRPAMTFREIIDVHGWPVASKRVAKAVRVVRENAPGTEVSRRLYLEGIDGRGNPCPHWKIPKRWLQLLDAPFLVGEKCCDVMKKVPSRQYEKETGRKCFIGTMVEDSWLRRRNYLQSGCNAFSGSRPVSHPLAVWSQEDIWDYISQHNLPYSSVYDMGYHNTGCIYCAFGAHREKEPNRFQLLRETHPALWRYCMKDLGLQDVLEYIGVPSGDELTLLSTATR